MPSRTVDVGCRLVSDVREWSKPVVPRLSDLYGPEVIYQHPLAYLLGLEGIALLRAWAGDYDQAFVEERLAEVRRLLDDPALGDHPGFEVRRGSTVEGYQQWAGSYDEPGNGLFDFDTPQLNAILDTLPIGRVLDAACGTGRLTKGLVARGHAVIGVDSSPDMLAQAERRISGTEFRLGELHHLPVPDHSVDVVLCALALSHQPDLGPAMSEFARVLAPGGHLLISDTHHDLILRGSVVKSLGPDAEPGLVPTYQHIPGAFLRAALPLGFALRDFQEPGDATDVPPPPLPEPTTDPGPWEVWPWSLMDLIPAATRAAAGTGYTVIWHFQLPDD